MATSPVFLTGKVRHNLVTKQKKLLSRDGTIWHDNVLMKIKTTHLRIFCPPRMPFALFLPIKQNLKVKPTIAFVLKLLASTPIPAKSELFALGEHSVSPLLQYDLHW